MTRPLAMLPSDTPAGDASHHIRNALQIIRLYSAPSPEGHETVQVAREDLEAVERRLHHALAQLQLPVVLAGESLHAFLNAVDRGGRGVNGAWWKRALEASVREDLITQDDAKGLMGAVTLFVERCEFCGCTEVNPCELVTAELSEGDRAAVDEYYREQGSELPATTPCWWVVDADVALCSKPSCQAAYAAARVQVNR